jgi:hypothetical protein
MSGYGNGGQRTMPLSGTTHMASYKSLSHSLNKSGNSSDATNVTAATDMSSPTHNAHSLSVSSSSSSSASSSPNALSTSGNSQANSSGANTNAYNSM